MKLLLNYTPLLNRQRTYFVEQIRNGTKKHTIRSEKYANLPYPVEVEHRYSDDVWTPCKGVITGTQEIDIVHLDENGEAYRTNGYSPLLIVDGNPLTENEAFNLILNDGFRDWDSFRRWFDDDYEGLILHFTDMRYD